MFVLTWCLHRHRRQYLQLQHALLDAPHNTLQNNDHRNYSPSSNSPSTPVLHTTSSVQSLSSSPLALSWQEGDTNETVAASNSDVNVTGSGISDATSSIDKRRASMGCDVNEDGKTNANDRARRASVEDLGIAGAFIIFFINVAFFFSYLLELSVLSCYRPTTPKCYILIKQNK